MAELNLSPGAFYELVRSCSRDGIGLRIQCSGSSMSPFVKHRAIVTLEPVSGTDRPCTGQIVAAAIDGRRRIIVHRITANRKGFYLLKGDNNLTADGWFSRKDILAVATTIENAGAGACIPGKWAGRAVALCSRTSLLQRLILPALRRLRGANSRLPGKISSIEGPEKVSL